MTVLFFVIPSVMIGNSLGHSVDMVVGTVIGFLTAKRITLFNPFTRIKDYFGLRRAINKLNERLKEHENRTRKQNQDQSAQEEAARRREQAKQEREQNQKQQRSESSSKNNGQSNRSKDEQNSYSNYRDSAQKPKVKTDLEKAYEVLGLKPTATHAEAKRARSKLMSLYHPDKLAGLPEGRRKQAEEEAKKINRAWDLING